MKKLNKLTHSQLASLSQGLLVAVDCEEAQNLCLLVDQYLSEWDAKVEIMQRKVDELCGKMLEYTEEGMKLNIRLDRVKFGTYDKPPIELIYTFVFKSGNSNYQGTSSDNILDIKIQNEQNNIIVKWKGNNLKVLP